jgi:hypothetical protein
MKKISVKTGLFRGLLGVLLALCLFVPVAAQDIDRITGIQSLFGKELSITSADVQTGVMHELGYEVFTHVAADGKTLLWKGVGGNALADEGEQSVLDCYLRAQNCPSTFYLRLFNDTPVETDTLADITGEPSSNGYVAKEVTRNTSGWVSLTLVDGDYKAVSAEQTFVATGGSWGPVTYCVMATTSNNTGKHITFSALSTSRTLANGETLKVTKSIVMQ